MAPNQSDDCPQIRAATAADLDAINAVIEKAIMTWNLPERVKRLSMNSYRYRLDELAYLSFLLAENKARKLLGVIALEPADSKDLPAGKSGVLVHGLYVEPDSHRQGVGRCLLQAATLKAGKQAVDGLLVKAQADANEFFELQGFERLTTDTASGNYPHRWWKSLPND